MERVLTGDDQTLFVGATPYPEYWPWCCIGSVTFIEWIGGAWVELRRYRNTGEKTRENFPIYAVTDAAEIPA